MSQFESGGFDDFAPARGGAPGAYGGQAATQQPFQGMMGGGGGRRPGGGYADGSLRPSPPTWVPDASVTCCGAPNCGTMFEMFERRHHCRYCGKCFCDACSKNSMLMPPQWEGSCGFATRDPQRVCKACELELAPYQARWVEQNCNANRTNQLDLEDSMMRYLNSPLRFTLGGEVRKAGYALKNMSDGINFWDGDAEYFDAQLQGAKGLLFLTVAKVAFIGGVRVGTGLLVARLPDGSWSAPCAVGSMGFTFGAGSEKGDVFSPFSRLLISSHVLTQFPLIVLDERSSLVSSSLEE